MTVGDQRLIALHVDDDFLISPAKMSGNFLQAVRTGRMPGRSHHPTGAGMVGGVGDTLIIRGNDHGRSAALDRRAHKRE
jgi:hypothetical protein